MQPRSGASAGALEERLALFPFGKNKFLLVFVGFAAFLLAGHGTCSKSLSLEPL